MGEKYYLINIYLLKQWSKPFNYEYSSYARPLTTSQADYVAHVSFSSVHRPIHVIYARPAYSIVHMYTVRAHATLQTTTLTCSQAENKFANMDIYIYAYGTSQSRY